MEKNNYNLPTNTGDILAEIIKKHRLGPVDVLDNPEMDKVLQKAKTPEETLKIIKDLPFEKVFDIIEKVAQGEIEIKNLSVIIKEELNISKQKADDLTNDLIKQIFGELKKETKKAVIIKKTLEQKEEKKDSKKDVYRELPE